MVESMDYFQLNSERTEFKKMRVIVKHMLQITTKYDKNQMVMVKSNI